MYICISTMYIMILQIHTWLNLNWYSLSAVGFCLYFVKVSRNRKSSTFDFYTECLSESWSPDSNLVPKNGSFIPFYPQIVPTTTLFFLPPLVSKISLHCILFDAATIIIYSQTFVHCLFKLQFYCSNDYLSNFEIT